MLISATKAGTEGEGIAREAGPGPRGFPPGRSFPSAPGTQRIRNLQNGGSTSILEAFSSVPEALFLQKGGSTSNMEVCDPLGGRGGQRRKEGGRRKEEGGEERERERHRPAGERTRAPRGP